jgi:hypothetical protein
MYSLANVSGAEAESVGTVCQGMRVWNYDAFASAVDQVFGAESQRLQ